jgi:hypothetical protein
MLHVGRSCDFFCKEPLRAELDRLTDELAKLQERWEFSARRAIPETPAVYSNTTTGAESVFGV